MIMNSREKDVQAKQEGDTTDGNVNITTVPKVSSTSSSRQWATFRNPRIVRVSRTFGGKDRHSKVCTVRGLRDRRIRLSVPTAIQLYDLQDRLGLSQPSKVVDWLLDATKNDIDKLPPLQFPPGSFGQFHQPAAALFPHQESSSSIINPSQFFNPNSSRIKENGGCDQNQQQMSSRGGININESSEREAASESNEQENNLGGFVAQLSAQNFFPLSNNQSSIPIPGLLNNAVPYNLSLAPFGNHYFPPQADDSAANIINHSLALQSPLFFCPPMATAVPSVPPYVNPYVNNTSSENETRQINPLQFLSSSSQHGLLNPSLMPNLRSTTTPVSLSGLGFRFRGQTDDNGRNITR